MNEKLSLISGILGRSYKSSGEHLFRCPYCKHHKNKFSVNIEKNVFKCWICDTRGSNLYRIVRRFGTFRDQERWKELTGFKQNLSEFDTIFQEETIEQVSETILSIPEGFHSLANPPCSKQATAALKYLYNRALDQGDILRWKIGYCDAGPFKNRIIIPSFNLDGDLNYFVARTYVDDYKRYMNPPISRDIVFNELYVDFEEEIVLVEGVFDALKATNAIPILGSTIRETSKIFKKIIANDTPVLMALDPDATRKSQAIKRLFLKYGIEVREIQYTDDRDIGDMSKSEVEELSRQAPFIQSYDNLISAIADI